jgi:hypothetical protein
MKRIEEAMHRLTPEERERSAEDISIVQKILCKTSNPKMAAVLALDLLLVGVDTVSTLGNTQVCALFSPYDMFRGQLRDRRQEISLLFFMNMENVTFNDKKLMT